VTAHDRTIEPLLAALTVELAGGGYAPEQTFGYSVEQLERAQVFLVAAAVAGETVGVAGLELQDDEFAELKRFYVRPAYRGQGVADALIGALLEHARAHGRSVVRLETGDRQRAALGFYRRHGFVEVDRFGPYVDSSTSICLQRQREIT
jgi:putative acetyltransferase